MKKLLNLIALGLVSALLVGCMRDGRDGNPGTNGVATKGDKGDKGGDGVATSVSEDTVGVVSVPNYARIISDLTGGKTLAMTILADARVTGGGANAAAQGLTAGQVISLVASADGSRFVSGGNNAVALNALNAPSNIAAVAGFPHANTPVPVLPMLDYNNLLSVNIQNAGAAPFDAANFYLIKFTSRVKLSNGVINGTGSIVFVAAVGLGAANSYTPAPVPFTYTIN